MFPHVHIYLFAVCVIKHAVHDVLGQFGFIRVGGSAHPRVNDALIVGALKRYLQKKKTYCILLVVKNETDVGH